MSEKDNAVVPSSGRRVVDFGEPPVAMTPLGRMNTGGEDRGLKPIPMTPVQPAPAPAPPSDPNKR